MIQHWETVGEVAANRMRGRGGGGGGRGRGGPYRREVSALGAGGAAGRRPRHVGAVVRRPVAPAHDAEGANHGLAPGHACGVQGEREITGHTSQRTHTHTQWGDDATHSPHEAAHTRGEGAPGACHAIPERASSGSRFTNV